MPLPALAAGAVPMQQLDWLIAEPVDAVALHGAGVRVRVPQPARYQCTSSWLRRSGMPARARSAEKICFSAGSHRRPARNRSHALDDALSDAVVRGRHGWRHPIERPLAEIGRS